MSLERFNQFIISSSHKAVVPLLRLGLFTVFFWFGLIKVLGLSPVESFVHDLYLITVPFIPFNLFYIGFALFECFLGILFLMKGAERLALVLLILHMIAACMPLVLLPRETWESFFVPTFEGQYIIKNIILIAAAISLVSHVHAQQKDISESVSA